MNALVATVSALWGLHDDKWPLLSYRYCPLCLQNPHSLLFATSNFSLGLICFQNDFLNVYLFMVALGLCCCVQAFSSCGERGLLSNWGALASHGSDFPCCGAQALRHTGVNNSSTELRRCGARAWLLHGMWNLQGRGWNLCLLHWQVDSYPQDRIRYPLQGSPWGLMLIITSPWKSSLSPMVLFNCSQDLKVKSLSHAGAPSVVQKRKRGGLGGSEWLGNSWGTWDSSTNTRDHTTSPSRDWPTQPSQWDMLS